MPAPDLTSARVAVPALPVWDKSLRTEWMVTVFCAL